MGGHVFAVIEDASRRIRILGVTAHPTASWVVQAAKNLVMDFEDAGCRARCLIRDRDGKFPRPFDEVLKDAGIEVVLSGVRMPRMNSIMERWVQTCRRELLDRTLIWNQRHLLRALREFETFYNEHRPHQGLANARPSPLAARSDRGPGPDRPSGHTTASATRWHPPRVSTCRLTSMEEVFGKRTVSEPASVAASAPRIQEPEDTGPHGRVSRFCDRSWPPQRSASRRTRPHRCPNPAPACEFAICAHHDSANPHASARSKAKVTGREAGSGGVVRRLEILGARPLHPDEEPARWLAEILPAIGGAAERHSVRHLHAAILSHMLVTTRCAPVRG